MEVLAYYQPLNFCTTGFQAVLEAFTVKLQVPLKEIMEEEVAAEVSSEAINGDKATD